MYIRVDACRNCSSEGTSWHDFSTCVCLTRNFIGPAARLQITRIDANTQRSVAAEHDVVRGDEIVRRIQWSCHEEAAVHRALALCSGTYNTAQHHRYRDDLDLMLRH